MGNSQSPLESQSWSFDSVSGNVERPVTITGRSDKPLQSVMINQQAAKITEGGLGFVFNNFYLREGNNMLSAVGTDAQGRKTNTSILVLRNFVGSSHIKIQSIKLRLTSIWL